MTFADKIKFFETISNIFGVLTIVSFMWLILHLRFYTFIFFSVSLIIYLITWPFRWYFKEKMKKEITM